MMFCARSMKTPKTRLAIALSFVLGELMSNGLDIVVNNSSVSGPITKQRFSLA